MFEQKEGEGSKSLMYTQLKKFISVIVSRVSN